MSLTPPSSAEGSPLGSPIGSPIVSEAESPVLEEAGENACGLCSQKLQQPRILCCLHVFCTHCLEKQVEGTDGDEADAGVATGQPPTGTIVCSVCKQETKLHGKGVEDLPLDIILMNILDKSAIGEMEIVCTSCKARETAVARCSDCANFLCPACVTAHQYMRCFENHKVVSFEDLQNGEGLALHKPMFCSTHVTENLKYFCNTCEVPVCQECSVCDHKQPEHRVERIADIEGKHEEMLRNLLAESKTKIEFCEQATFSLESSLSDLQMQRDNAHGLIEETFQTYRTILERIQMAVSKELDQRHSELELNIMEMFHNIEKTTERFEDSCKFTEQVLAHGNSVEVLMMKKLITSQLLLLINNTPKPEVNIRLEFESDQDKFEDAVRANFGSLKTGKEEQEAAPEDEIETDEEELPKVRLAEMPSIPPLEIMTMADWGEEPRFPAARPLFATESKEMGSPLIPDLGLPPGLLSPHPTVLPPVSNADFLPPMHTIPPLSLPNIASLASSISVGSDTISSIASSMPTLSSERSSSRNSYSPAMSDSGISMDAASTSSSSAQPMLNLTGLAKLGNIGVNAQGQITLNNTAIPGLNVNNMTSISQMMGPRSQTPTPGQQPPQDQASASIANLLSLSGSRSHTPQLPDIPGLNNLLGQPTGHLNGIGGIGTLPPTSGLLNPPLAPPGAGSLGNLHAGMNLTTPPPMTPSFNTSNNPHQNPHPPFPTRGSGKMSAMQIRCKFGQLGPGKGQFSSPHGFCLGLEQDIIVADTNNHRVQVFEKTGEFKYQFGIPGREEGQLWYPRKVAVIRHSGKYVVCDRGNERSRMQIFTKSGHFIKKIAIRYIDIVAGLAITQQGHIVAVDSVSPTVFCIAESGDLLKWFDCSDYMREPSDIAVSGKEYFVCDFKGHCIVVFNEEGQFIRRIGCESITNFPNGIDISDAGDVLVGDSHGNRFHVAVFQRDGSLIGEFECPYVKVSRCCGLKITSEGYVVTLAKNNHHVLVLNTLYIT